MKSIKPQNANHQNYNFLDLQSSLKILWNLFAKQSPKRFRQEDEERELLMNISMKWINFFSFIKEAFHVDALHNLVHTNLLLFHTNFHLSSGPLGWRFMVLNENIMRSTITMLKRKKRKIDFLTLEY